jgi:putative spermidine/putrescine transport system permease protein
MTASALPLSEAASVPALLRRWAPALFVLPLTLALLLAFVWPLLEGAVNSFHPFTRAGIDKTTWTLANYAALFDSYYFGILLRTVRISLIVTAVTALLAYPVAIYIAELRPRAQALMLLVYMAPWLVNVVVKAFGWSLILSTSGVINQSLRALGLIDAPLRLMLNETGVVIGLVHGHFIFVLLPVWAALSALDPNLRWAAGTLGAKPWQIFWKVTLPLTLPALFAGLIINFTMNMTAFATPALLGGARARVVSYLAYEVNLVDLNWPLGSAMAVALLAITSLLVWFSQRIASSGKRRVVFEGAR